MVRKITIEDKPAIDPIRRAFRTRELSEQIKPLQAQLELLTELQKSRNTGEVDYLHRISVISKELDILREEYFSLI